MLQRLLCSTAGLVRHRLELQALEFWRCMCYFNIMILGSPCRSSEMSLWWSPLSLVSPAWALNGCKWSLTRWDCCSSVNHLLSLSFSLYHPDTEEVADTWGWHTQCTITSLCVPALLVAVTQLLVIPRGCEEPQSGSGCAQRWPLHNGRKGPGELSSVRLACDARMLDAGAFWELVISTKSLVRRVMWCLGVHSEVKSSTWINIMNTCQLI